MKKLALILFSAAAGSLVLIGCASAQPKPQAPAGASGGTGASATQNVNAPLNLTLEEKLAYGTLKLEGTSIAVTSQEASQLLPLWQRVQSLETQGNASASDLQAVYKQIESDMTSNQIETIQGLTPTTADLRSEMQQEGIQGGANGFGFGGQNPSQRATRIAQFETQNPGTPFPARGTPGAGFPRNGTPGPRFQGTPFPNRTPGAGGFGSRGFTFVFVNPLIKLLQTRAGG